MGGPPVVAQSLATAQAAMGHSLHVVSYESPGRQTVPRSDAVQWHLIDVGNERLERLTAWNSRSALRQAFAGADAVHLHGVWDALLKASGATARKLGVGYALAPHGMLDPWSLAQKPLKKRLALASGYQGLLDHAAFLHLLNADEAKLIEPLRLRCPCEVIPNGISPEQFADLPPGGAFRAAHPELGDRPYVLFLGRLHPKKGLDVLADAFALLAARRPELDLVIAGPDDGGLGAFRQRIEAANGRVAGLAARAHVVGPVYGADKLAALVDAAVFCLPSRQEGFSMAIIEAMACGLPVVVSDACHFPEVVEAGAGESVPLSADNVAAALDRVLNDAPGRGRRLGEAGRRLVLERFTWPRIAESTIAAYRRRMRPAVS